MTMNFKQIASRLTGIRCPVFGVSWNPPEVERSVARRVVTVLEDRRVHYVDSEMEVPAHCVESVLQIRGLLTDEIAPLRQEAEITQSLCAMRLACRKFLGAVNADEGRIIHFGAQQGHYASWKFNGALGVLAASSECTSPRSPAAYGVDVEDELASILPEGTMPPNNTIERTR